MLFEIGLFIHSQFVIRHLESLFFTASQAIQKLPAVAPAGLAKHPLQTIRLRVRGPESGNWGSRTLNRSRGAARSHGKRPRVSTATKFDEPSRKQWSGWPVRDEGPAGRLSDPRRRGKRGRGERRGTGIPGRGPANAAPATGVAVVGPGMADGGAAGAGRRWCDRRTRTRGTGPASGNPGRPIPGPGGSGRRDPRAGPEPGAAGRRRRYPHHRSQARSRLPATDLEHPRAPGRRGLSRRRGGRTPAPSRGNRPRQVSDPRHLHHGRSGFGHESWPPRDEGDLPGGS